MISSSHRRTAIRTRAASVSTPAPRNASTNACSASRKWIFESHSVSSASKTRPSPRAGVSILRLVRWCQSLIGSQFETLQEVEIVGRQPVLAGALDQQAEVTGRGFASLGNFVRLIGERRDCLAGVNHDLHWNSLVGAGRHAFSPVEAVEPLGGN